MGLGNTWLPRGFFGELEFTCPGPTPPVGPHRVVHNPAVRRKDVQPTPPFVIAVYVVVALTGQVTVQCPIHGVTLMVYVPNPDFKDFTGNLPTVADGSDISIVGNP